MHRGTTSRSRAIAAQGSGPQPSAILTTMGLITVLMLVWFGLQ